MDAEARLRAVSAVAGFDLEGRVEPLPSDSNDAWRIGDTVLRICWRGDRDRLRREAAILENLPESVPHVGLLEVGDADGLTWMLTDWMEGQVLASRWPRLPDLVRRRAATELARILEALHGWTPDQAVLAVVTRRPAPLDIESVIGADVNPLPVGRALSLIARAGKAPYADPGLLSALGDRLEELRAVDPLAAPARHVIHGDAHLGNVLWRDGRIVALLDFEWARLGPPDLELQPFIRPEEGHPDSLIRALLRNYGALSEPHDLVERLWLYDLAFTLRHLIVWPAYAPPDDLPPFHPLSRLPTIVKDSSYITRLVVEHPTTSTRHP